MLFSDEVHFDLHGNVNCQNMWCYSETNPKVTREEPLHSPYSTVWYALSGTTITGPHFFEDETGANVTITTEQCFIMLKTFFIPKLQCKWLPCARSGFNKMGPPATQPLTYSTSCNPNFTLNFLPVDTEKSRPEIVVLFPLGPIKGCGLHHPTNLSS